MAKPAALVRQGGVTINGAVIADETQHLTIAEGDILQVGKRRFAKLSLA